MGPISARPPKGAAVTSPVTRVRAGRIDWCLFSEAHSTVLAFISKKNRVGLSGSRARVAQTGPKRVRAERTRAGLLLGSTCKVAHLRVRVVSPTRENGASCVRFERSFSTKFRQGGPKQSSGPCVRGPRPTFSRHLGPTYRFWTIGGSMRISLDQVNPNRSQNELA